MFTFLFRAGLTAANLQSLSIHGQLGCYSDKTQSISHVVKECLLIRFSSRLEELSMTTEEAIGSDGYYTYANKRF